MARAAALRHLTGRFLGSLRPGGPSPDDEAWVWSVLLPGERALWGRMSGADRRHAVGVARRVSRPDLAAPARLHVTWALAESLRAYWYAVPLRASGTSRLEIFRPRGAAVMESSSCSSAVCGWSGSESVTRTRKL